jgi:di/tricarboxylate transporter
LLSQRLVQTNDRLQASNESRQQWIKQQIEDLGDEWGSLLIECSLYPHIDNIVLSTIRSGFTIEAIVGKLPQGTPLLRSDGNVHPDRITLSSAIKPTLHRLLTERRSPEEIDELRERAAKGWIENGAWGAAIQMYAESEQWEAALDIAEQAPSSDEGLRCLDRCPSVLLLSRFEMLEKYLKFCAESKSEAGFAKVETLLDQSSISLTIDQRMTLYECAAEICQRLGMKQKSLDYLAMADSLSEALSDRSDDAEEDSSERSYRLAKQKLDSHRTKERASKAGLLLRGTSWNAIVALLLVVTCLSYFHFAPPLGTLSRHGMDFIGIGIAAVVLWIVNLIADYIVALFMAMFWVLGGLVTPQVALSGFSSTTWLYMLFILAFGAVITKSGILFRLSLHALKRFPANYRGQLWGIVAGGTLLNPLIPSSSAKVTLGVPIARTLSESMGFKDRSHGAAGLSLAAMVFYGFTAPFVLTGSYSNVLAFGLVQGIKQPSWFQWFLYALPAFIVFTVLILGFLSFQFRNVTSAKPISRKVLDDQLQLLGRLTRQEKITVLTVVGSIAALIAQPWHGIDNAWVLLIGFAVLVITGTLDSQTLKTGVDWTFLIFIGIAFSFADAAKQLGIIEAMSSFLGDRMAPFMDTPALFLGAVMCLAFIVTFVVRDDPALILLVIAMLPLAEQAGIHPWVLVFVILLSTDPFFFAYQSPTYLTAYYSAEGKSFNHRQGQWVALAYVVSAMIAVMASVPYWKWLGLIH